MNYLVYMTPKGMYEILKKEEAKDNAANLSNYLIFRENEELEKYQFIQDCETLEEAKGTICLFLHHPFDDTKWLDDNYLKIIDDNGETTIMP